MRTRSTDEDPSLVAEIYRRHGEAVERYVRRRVPEADVDDVVSEVFLVLAGGKPAPLGVEQLPWLYAVSYRVVGKHYSRTARRSRLLERVRSGRPLMVGDPADQISSTAWMDDLFSRLSPSDAELLRLVVFEDLTATAAAAVLGISAGAAHTRLHRIRNKVQPWLDQATPAAHLKPTATAPERSRP